MAQHIEKERFIRETTGNYARSIEITGHISTSGNKDDRYSVYRLKIDKIDTISPPGSTYIWVRIPRNLTVEVGDTLSWKGKIRSVSYPSGSGYREYSFLHKVYGTSSVYLFDRKISETKSIFQTIRETIRARISLIFPGDSGGLLSGILVGNTDDINDQTKLAFQISGLSHILAVSGSNVTFLLIILEKIIRYFRLGRSVRISIISTMLILFMIIAGFDVPVIRATIMGVLMYLGFSFDTKLESIAILFVVMLGFILYEPLYLMHDVGLMLSCLATASILTMKRWLEKIVSFLPDTLSLRESAIICIAASLGTGPYLLSVFGIIPVFGIFANLLLGPIVGWIMFFGMLSLVVSYVSSFLAYLVGYIPYLCIEYMLLIGEYTASISPSWSMESLVLRDIIVICGLLFVIINIFEFIWARLLRAQKAYLHPPY